MVKRNTRRPLNKRSPCFFRVFHLDFSIYRPSSGTPKKGKKTKQAGGHFFFLFSSVSPYTLPWVSSAVLYYLLLSLSPGVGRHLPQTPGDLSEGLGPSGGGVCHHRHVHPHVPGCRCGVSECWIVQGIEAESTADTTHRALIGRAK